MNGLMPLYMSEVVFFQSALNLLSAKNWAKQFPSGEFVLVSLSLSSLHICLRYLLGRSMGLEKEIKKESSSENDFFERQADLIFKDLIDLHSQKWILIYRFLFNMLILLFLKIISMHSDLLVKDFLKKEGVPLFLRELEPTFKIALSSLSLLFITKLLLDDLFRCSDENTASLRKRNWRSKSVSQRGVPNLSETLEIDKGDPSFFLDSSDRSLYSCLVTLSGYKKV